MILKLPKARAFTLIELMVVIAIIGLLATIVTVSLTSAQKKGRDAKRISDIKNIQLALETYFSDNTSYPLTLGQLAPTYLSTVPSDPSNPAVQYSYITWNAGNSQVCNASTIVIGYHLGAGLEDSTNSSLLQDRDLLQRTPNTSNCGGAQDFDGRNTTTNNACTLGAWPGGLTIETCYDVTN